jgi:predicted TPR repeat methyltransferase
MAAPLFFSSGDYIADRRYDFGRDLQLRGDLAGAADLMRQAVETVPGFVSAWFALGDISEQRKRRDDAIAAYRKAWEADPADRHGARLRLMRLGAEPMAAMTPGYVRSLFDQYAPRFDRALREHLGYRGPEVLREALVEARHVQKRPVHFRRALDLGCGTGLAAEVFASLCDEMVGVDLSPGMLEKAGKRKLYAVLKEADMLAALGAEPDGSADLVLAADAVVYVSDVAPLCTEAARVLAPHGAFAFTAETHDGEGVILRTTLRYAHAADYLKKVLGEAGLRVVVLQSVSARNEGGEPAPGLVAVAVKG